MHRIAMLDWSSIEPAIFNGLANLQTLDAFLSYAFMPVTAVWPRAIAFLSLVGLAIGGAVIIRRRAPVTVLFLAAYTAVVMLWPRTCSGLA